MAEKTALFAPIPRASVRMTTSENDGDFRIKRIADLRLRTARSRKAGRWTSRRSCVSLLLAAELQHGLAVRLFWRHSTGDVVLGEFLDVKTEFAINIVFEGVSAKKCFQPSPWRLLLGFLQDESDCLGQSLPVRFLGNQLFAAAGRQPIELGLAAVVGFAPVSLQPSALFQAMQGGIERALLHLEYILRYLTNALCDSVAVYGAEGNNLKDEHVERALQKVRFIDRHEALS